MVVRVAGHRSPGRRGRVSPPPEPRPADPSPGGSSPATDPPARPLNHHRTATPALAAPGPPGEAITRARPAAGTPPVGHRAILFTAEQAGVLLAVPGSWLRDRAAARAIPCRRLGKHLRFSLADLTRIAEMAARPAHPPASGPSTPQTTPPSTALTTPTTPVAGTAIAPRAGSREARDPAGTTRPPAPPGASEHTHEMWSGPSPRGVS